MRLKRDALPVLFNNHSIVSGPLCHEKDVDAALVVADSHRLYGWHHDFRLRSLLVLGNNWLLVNDLSEICDDVQAIEAKDTEPSALHMPRKYEVCGHAQIIFAVV